MKSLEYYKKQASDAMQEGLSHEKEIVNWKELFDGLKQKGNYQKMASLFRIIKELAPEMISAKILNMFSKDNYSQLPFNPDKLNFKGKIDRGAEHQVYLLESTIKENPSYVLKLNYQNSGSLEEIKKRTIEFKKEYEEIRERYSAMPGLIPEEMTIVVSDFKSGNPSMATIQNFFGGKIRDPLSDFDKDELIYLLKKESRLLDEFKQFCEITEREYAKKNVAIDLIGDRNLSIVESEDGLKLKVLDPHNSVSRVKDDERTKRQEARMRELKDILRAAT